MPCWTTLVIGLLVLAFGIAVVIEGSVQIVGVIQLVVSVPVIILGIKNLRKKQKTQQPPSA